MLIFYIICGVVVFALSSFLYYRNRLALYRRRVIRQLSNKSEQQPFRLSATQESTIKQCFLSGFSYENCIKELDQQD
jgi:hypothetical protein